MNPQKGTFPVLRSPEEKVGYIFQKLDRIVEILPPPLRQRSLEAFAYNTNREIISRNNRGRALGNSSTRKETECLLTPKKGSSLTSKHNLKITIQTVVLKPTCKKRVNEFLRKDIKVAVKNAGTRATHELTLRIQPKAKAIPLATMQSPWWLTNC